MTSDHAATGDVVGKFRDADEAELEERARNIQCCSSGGKLRGEDGCSSLLMSGTNHVRVGIDYAGMGNWIFASEHILGDRASISFVTERRRAARQFVQQQYGVDFVREPGQGNHLDPPMACPAGAARS